MPPFQRERTEPAVRAGDIIDGKYVVGEVIARGGMGIVTLATHVHLRKEVALKFVRPDLLHNPEIVARFMNEARAAASLRNDHVARVLDFGMTDAGTHYLVMERLEGSSLSVVLKQWGPLPPSEVADYVLQACEALAEAHALGIVHRDVKPENLFLTQGVDNKPVLKVLDFGISKQLASEVDRTLTNPTSSMGSPWYMSPEQMRNARDVDPRTDIWSIGVVLFELLTGRTPFGGRTLTEICSSVLCDAPPRVRELRPDVPVGLEAVVHRCLQKERNGRFADISELAQALAPFASPAGRASMPRVQGIAIGAARPFDRREDASASWGIQPAEEISADPRLTRVPGEHFSLTPMFAAISLVGMAVMGAAGSLGYDVVRPFRGALVPEAALFADPAAAPLERDLDVAPFTPLFGPARAVLEREVYFGTRALAARPFSPPALAPVDPPAELPSNELLAVPPEP